MTEQKIDYISINDLFWVQIKPHLISFGFKGLSENIHFTIGFDERSPDINLHITKNTSNQNNKPHIKIVVIEKKIVQEIENSLLFSILNMILEPIDLDELQSNYDFELGYLPYDKIENSEATVATKQRLISNFKKMSKIKRKSRLKIQGNIEEPFENLIYSTEFQQTILDNIEGITDNEKASLGGGILLFNDSVLNVIRINDDWYKLRTNLALFDWLCAFVNPELAQHIINKTKQALEAIKNADSYSDTENLNSPIRLVLLENII